MGLFDGAFDNADGQGAALAQALQDAWDGGKETASNVAGALTDGQFYRDVSGGLRDVAGRGVAQTLGGAVDLAFVPLNLAGLDDPEPTLGSEWFGRKMEDAGLISPERRPVAEMLAGFVSPTAVAPNLARRASQAVGHAFTNNLPRLNTVSPSGAVYAMSREGQTGLREAFQKGTLNGELRLGDVTAAQYKTYLKEGGIKSDSLDVVLKPEVFNKVYLKHMIDEGYTVEEMVQYAKQAMAKGSDFMRDPGKGKQHGSLISKQAYDPVTGKPYNATMPLTSDGKRLETVSFFPDGLRPRKK